jgi:glycosyltransferase involved in cell wall biosynthesis
MIESERTNGSAPAENKGAVSVLIPVLNEEACIRDTVAAMQSQRYDGEIEFLFMDGRSEDRTRALLAELAETDQRIRVLDNPARRTPNGLNVGLRHARGEYVARMDAHTYYSADYVAKGVERLERGDVVWVSGPAIPEGTGRWSRRVALALGSRLGVGGSRKWSSSREVELDSGVFAGVWRRSTLLVHRGWDEGWPANQDSELAARVHEAGGRIVCLPELAGRYIPRNSLRGLARQYWRYGYYRAKTARRHPGSLRRSHVLPPGLALALPLAVLVPGPLAWLPRTALLLYAASVLGASMAALRRARPADAAALPAVFVTMHLAWGTGFVGGALRFGPPIAALTRALVPGRRAPAAART